MCIYTHMTHICESHYNSLTWHGYFHCLWPWPFLSIYRNLVRCNNGHITEIHTGAGQGTESKVKSALQRRCHIFSIELFHAFLPCIPNVFARVFENKTKRSRSEVEVHHQSWHHYLHFMPCQKLLLIGPLRLGQFRSFRKSREPKIFSNVAPECARYKPGVNCICIWTKRMTLKYCHVRNQLHFVTNAQAYAETTALAPVVSRRHGDRSRSIHSSYLRFCVASGELNLGKSWVCAELVFVGSRVHCPKAQDQNTIQILWLYWWWMESCSWGAYQLLLEVFHQQYHIASCSKSPQQNFPVTTLSAGALWNLSRPIPEVKVLPKKNELDVVGLTDLVLAFITAMTTAPSATCCMQFDCAGDLLSGFEILESFAW